MKKIFTLTFALAGAIISSFGQCVPATANLSQSQLIYPAMVPCIQPNIPYTSVLSIEVPDTVPGSDFNNPEIAAFNVIIDSVNIQSITGYPSGITSSSSPALGSWIHAGGYACTAFSGTTTAPVGNYPLTISGIGCGHVNFPIVGAYDTCMPINFSSIYPYDLQVCDTLCSNTFDTTYATLCRGDSIQWGSNNVKRGGRYIDTVLNANGCDTLKLLFATTANPAFGRDSLVGCRSVSYGGNTYTQDTTLMITYTNASANGCDSTVRYNVIVGGLITPGITASGTALTAVDSPGTAASYQWLQNGAPISSATSASYSPTGATLNNYSVVVTDYHGCSDTSGVFAASGVNEISAQNVKLYPNPNNGSFILETRNAIGAVYSITNSLGQVIEQRTISSAKQIIDLGNVSTGVYTLSMKGVDTIQFTVTK